MDKRFTVFTAALDISKENGQKVVRAYIEESHKAPQFETHDELGEWAKANLGRPAHFLDQEQHNESRYAVIWCYWQNRDGKATAFVTPRLFTKDLKAAQKEMETMEKTNHSAFIWDIKKGAEV